MTGDEDFNPESWIRELRNRLHNQGNHLQRLEGQMLADRLVGEERNRNIETTNREVKADISALSGLVSALNVTMTQIGEGQRSILQTMESDRQARIETAAALEAANKARRDRDSEPWITPNRVIGLIVGLLAIAAFLHNSGAKL